jgi:hypothetical protein
MSDWEPCHCIITSNILYYHNTTHSAIHINQITVTSLEATQITQVTATQIMCSWLHLCAYLVHCTVMVKILGQIYWPANKTNQAGYKINNGVNKLVYEWHPTVIYKLKRMDERQSVTSKLSNVLLYTVQHVTPLAKSHHQALWKYLQKQLVHTIWKTFKWLRSQPYNMLCIKAEVK